MNPIHVYKLAVRSNEDNWPRTEEQISRMIQYLIKNDKSLIVDSIEWQGTIKTEKNTIHLNESEAV